MSNLPPHSKMITLRLTDADHAVVTARATRAGLTVSEYMRRAALGTLPPTAAQREAERMYNPTTTATSAPEWPSSPPAPSVRSAVAPKYLSFADGNDPA